MLRSCLLACFLAGFIEQLTEGIAEALVGIQGDWWPCTGGGFAGGPGGRLRSGGCGRLGFGTARLIGTFLGGTEPWVLELLLQEVRN